MFVHNDNTTATPQIRQNSADGEALKAAVLDFCAMILVTVRVAKIMSRVL